MPDNTVIPSRKTDHIRINVEEDVKSGSLNGFERYTFIHNALPEIDLNQVCLGKKVFNKELRAPLLISSMTGGTPEAHEINLRLAVAAQSHGLAMGVGSQRAGIDLPELAETFKVRSKAPDILLFANIGAVQLNYQYGIDQCRRAVDMIQADALFLHLNPLQEALQPEGETNFSGLMKKIADIVKKLEVPVIVKEVGWGISAEVACALSEIGVAAVDVAGSGGTSWAMVEKFRQTDPVLQQIANDFHNWGLATADALKAIHAACPSLALFASGGLQNGLEMAKAIALGADLCGFAGPFIRAAVRSDDAVDELIRYLLLELRITMFSLGHATLAELRNSKRLVESRI